MCPNNAIIPGLMPYPAQDHGKFVLEADPLGGCRGVVYEEDGLDRLIVPIKVRLEDLHGCTLLNDPKGESIFMRRNTDRKKTEYVWMADARKGYLPYGSSKLHVLVSNRIEREFIVQQPYSTFLTVKPNDPHEFAPVESQTGVVGITHGVTDFWVAFPFSFRRPPSVILPVVYTDQQADPILLLSAFLKSFDQYGFNVQISAAPNTEGYRLGWAAWL